MAPEPLTATSVLTNPIFPRCTRHSYRRQQRIRWTDRRRFGPNRTTNKWHCDNRTTLSERRLKNPVFAAEPEKSAITQCNSDPSMKGKLSFTSVPIASIRGASTIRRKCFKKIPLALHPRIFLLSRLPCTKWDVPFRVVIAFNGPGAQRGLFFNLLSFRCGQSILRVDW